MKKTRYNIVEKVTELSDVRFWNTQIYIVQISSNQGVIGVILLLGEKKNSVILMRNKRRRIELK